MLKRILGALVVLLCFVSIANAQFFVPYAKTLEEHGFNNYKRDGNVFYFHNQGIMVLATVDSNWNLLSSTIAFDKTSAIAKDVIAAVYLTYLNLQTQLGKDLLFDYRAGSRKMKYLLETIDHNLKFLAFLLLMFEFFD
jgi:hypothetical protein